MNRCNPVIAQAATILAVSLSVTIICVPCALVTAPCTFYKAPFFNDHSWSGRAGNKVSSALLKCSIKPATNLCLDCRAEEGGRMTMEK